ncbi:hypothetical protein G4228_012049 [Cervus hanglu yarkandensis]|nr:hypothetical protein G4228_012049 [Cervus hanglu yarkandensis]
MPVAVMAASSFSFRKLLDQWENQELEAPGETVTPPVYGQLLNLYLLHNNMNNAGYF